MRAIARGWCAVGVFGAIALMAPCGEAQAQPAPGTSADLAALFAPGGLLQDRNGDGVIDFVNARVVLGERPSAADVSAAADLAARLGFETMAMDLPLSATPEGGATALIVGLDGVRRTGATPPKAMASLGPGDGMIVTTTASDAPAVIVAGADAAGTMAAAELLAGRLPPVLDPDGPSLSQVASDVRTVLVGGGSAVGSVTIPAVTVRAGADEIRAIDVTVTVPTAAAAASAAQTLRRLIASPSTRPAGALSYPGAAMIRIEIAAAGARPPRPMLVEIPRTERSRPRPVPPRPGSDAKEKLTLANIFTSDGLLGDSDSNRIVDRFDMLLCPSGDGIEGTVELAARLGLESTGISIPVALPPDRVEKPEDEPTLVLIGTAQPLVDQLVKEQKFGQPVWQPGAG